MMRHATRIDPRRKALNRKRIDAALEDHRAGRLDAAESKYRRVLDTDPEEPDALHLLALCRHQRGDDTDAMPWAEKAVAVKPGSPAFHNTLGRVLRGLQQYERACEVFRQALTLDPDYLDAQKSLALTYADMGAFDEAERLLRSAIERWPADADLWSIHGRGLLFSDRVDAAVQAFERALELAPYYVGALSNLGTAYDLLGRHDDAMTAFERALAVDPDHAETNLNYAHQLLKAGAFHTGWTHYEWRLKRSRHMPPHPAPRWQGEPLEGRTIALRCEQGFGDAIQFVRYAPMVAARGGAVTIECRKPLLRLFAGVDGVADVVEPGPADHCDMQCPLLSLPGMFRTRMETIPDRVPYLPVPEAAALDCPAGTKRVGLVWAGSPGHKRDRHRSRPLSDFAPLAKVPGATFFGLQVGPAADEPRPAGMQVADLVSDVNDFLDTARVLAALDLVIAVDTAVAHLAGAMGLPVWLLTDKAGDWRWLEDREDSPWYPTMRLFRRRDGWDDVFQRVAAALAEY